MPAYVGLKKAKVLSVDERRTRKGNRMLSLYVQTWRNRAYKGQDPDFESAEFSVTVFNADGLNIDKEDKLDIKGELRIDTNPNWIQIRKEDRTDRSVEGKESQFLEVLAFPDNIEVVEKGDRTSRRSDRQARDAEEQTTPRSDHWDDLPF